MTNDEKAEELLDHGMSRRSLLKLLGVGFSSLLIPKTIVTIPTIIEPPKPSMAHLDLLGLNPGSRVRVVDTESGKTYFEGVCSTVTWPVAMNEVRDVKVPCGNEVEICIENVNNRSRHWATMRMPEGCYPGSIMDMTLQPALNAQNFCGEFYVARAPMRTYV
jgi:hypothetical protein